MASCKKVSDLTTLFINCRSVAKRFHKNLHKNRTKNFGIVLRTQQTRFKQAVNLSFCVILYHKNILQGTDMVEGIVRQLAQANENLTGNVLKTILTANKVKELICMHMHEVKFHEV